MVRYIYIFEIFNIHANIYLFSQLVKNLSTFCRPTILHLWLQFQFNNTLQQLVSSSPFPLDFFIESRGGTCVAQCLLEIDVGCPTNVDGSEN